jgi:hypothetical protein
MAQVHGVPALVSANLRRITRPRILDAAIIVVCLTFPKAAAWGQSLFTFRDLDTGIHSNVTQSVSLRFMRHIWVVNYGDPVIAAVVQQGGYGGHGQALYKSLNDGADWTLECDLASETDIVSDGVLDSNNNLLLVTSLLNHARTADVDFMKLTYNPSAKSWTIDPLTPVTVYASNDNGKATRASISVDSNGVIWCAVRFLIPLSGIPGIVQIRVFYSTDGGYNWVDSGNRFGTANWVPQKSAKVISVGSRTALIYEDRQVVPAGIARYKAWAYREDSQPLQDHWTNQIIAQMVSAEDDSLGSHWSVASDGIGNLHLSYEDAGIRYLKYDASTGAWLSPALITTYDGQYNSLSVAGNNDVYLFSRFTSGAKVFCKRYSPGTHSWSRWLAMSSTRHDGLLRMSSPEKFADQLPLLYEVNGSPPYDLLYVLFSTSALTLCRQAP